MTVHIEATTTPTVLSFFKVLGDETRLTIMRLLALGDYRVGELVDQLRQPQNAVSYHLKQLRALGLLRDRRSNGDGRDVYYSVDLARLQQLYASAGDALHPGMTTSVAEQEALPKLEQPLRILYLCTHNRARSQMAEGITRYLAGDQVAVYSAGNLPSEVHPLTIEMLNEIGVDTDGLRSKSMEEFVTAEFDYVITTCDRIRGGCPTFPGDPRQIHWSFPDPSEVEGGSEAQRQAFCIARRELMTRIRYLLSLPHPVTGQRIMVRSMTAQEHAAL